MRDRFHFSRLHGSGLLLLLIPLCMPSEPLHSQVACSPQPKQVPSTSSAPATPASAPAIATSSGQTRFQPPVTARRAAMFYGAEWGIDELRVKAVESGELIRFSYEVLDPVRARTLNDKKLEPSLIFPAGHITLVIPSLEKVGQLRQVSTQEAGKSYWMAFSNPGRRVKRGDRVDIAIGPFHAEGLVVE